MAITPTGFKKLTELETRFVELYCSTAKGNAAQAARDAGYSRSVSETAHTILHKPHVQAAIDEWRENRKRTFFVTESMILERMWQEANYYDQGATHAGRINALVWLGKHLGVFSDKKESKYGGSGNTYNIVDYSGATGTLEDKKTHDLEVQKAIEAKESEVIEAIPAAEQSIEVELTDYSSESESKESSKVKAKELKDDE